VVWGLKVFTHGHILSPLGAFGHIYNESMRNMA
jgi:hypothetical protein